MSLFTGRFRDQVAVVTGAASGIGRAVAERLTAEGAKVSGWDISAPGLDSAGAGFAQKIVMDQADEHSVAEATRQTIAQFGYIDVLVVSAGITGPNSPLAEYPCD